MKFLQIILNGFNKVVNLLDTTQKYIIIAQMFITANKNCISAVKQEYPELFKTKTQIIDDEKQ